MEDIEREPDRRGRRPNALVVFLGVLFLAAVAFYLWTGWRARQEVADRTGDLLRLSAIPLGFAVRAAILEGDLAAVDLYLDRLAAEPGVERVVLAGADGAIRVSTDRALIGRRLTDVLPDLDAAADEVEIVHRDDRHHAVVPITGINERLGILVLTYAPETAASGEAPER